MDMETQRPRPQIRANNVGEENDGQRRNSKRTTLIRGIHPMEDAPENVFLWENIIFPSFLPPGEKK